METLGESEQFPVGKYRKWNAHITVSASGPEYTPLLERHSFSHPRLAADLRYTTADVDFMEQYWRSHWESLREVEGAQRDLHLRLRNPSLQEFRDTFDQAARWMRGFRDDPLWDGGDLIFSFAGHGRLSDGALCLTDGFITVDDFLACLYRVHQHSPRKRLRVNVSLDSCYSGAFLTAFVARALHLHSDWLFPYTVWAGCMSDEMSWEDGDLGHGLFTYCFSCRASLHQRWVASAIQPDNSYGPSLTIAEGSYGCSMISLGRQNPVTFWGDGWGSLEVCGDRFDLSDKDGNNTLTEPQMNAKLAEIRNRFREQLKPLMRKVIVNYDLSEEEVRAEIRRHINER